MRINCEICNRQIVNYEANDQCVIGGKSPTRLIGNQYICYECAKELDKNGNFPEEVKYAENVWYC